MEKLLSVVLAIFVSALSVSENLNTAYAEPRQIFNVSAEYEVWTGRVLSVSTTSPITKAIRSDAEGDKKLQRAFDLFEGLTDETTRRRSNKDSRACNIPRSVRWAVRARQRLPIFQIGFINEECFTRMDVNEAVKERYLPSDYSKQTRTIIREAREVFADTMSRITFYRDGNWSASEAPYAMTTHTYIGES